mgnify:CR=1 FL=1
MQNLVLLVCLTVFAFWAFVLGFRQEVSNFLNAKSELMRAKAKEINVTTLLLEKHIKDDLKDDLKEGE